MVFYIYKMKNVNYIGSTDDFENKKNKIKLEILAVYKRKCNNKIKLLVLQYYINKYDSVNNGKNACNVFIKKKSKKEIKESQKKSQKIYYEKNKKKIIEREKKKMKIYYKKNRNKILKKGAVKINCPICNCLIRKDNLRRHKKTKKCLKVKNSNISQDEIDFKYNQNAYNEEGEFLEWF